MTLITKGTPLGFVGVGNLGQAMSLHLAEQGWPIRVFDKAAVRTGPLAAAGAQPIDIKDLPECQVLCFAVPDASVVREVLERSGTLIRLTSDHMVILHSTVLPTEAQGLAELVGTTGARFLEAPVSGGADRARTGELTLLTGGDEEDVAHARPLLDVMAREVFHLGPIGAGSATKLANQLIMFSALAGVSEALELAGAYGVREEDVLAAVSTGTGDTWVGRNWGFFDRVAADYNRSGTPLLQRPWSKDLWEILGAARDRQSSVPVAGLLAQILADTVEDHARAAEMKEGSTR